MEGCERAILLLTIKCRDEKCQTVKRLCIHIFPCPSNQTLESLYDNNNNCDNKDFSRDELQVLEFSNLLTGNLMMGKGIQSLFSDSEICCCFQ